MADPFRLRVLKALTEAIGSIYPDSPGIPADPMIGYPGWTMETETDLRGKVFRGRNRFGEEDPVPLVSILEPPIPLETLVGRNTNTHSAGGWELLIQGFVDDDKKNPSDPAHRLMAEVKARLVAEKRRGRGNNILGLGGRVTELSLGQGSVRPSDEASDKTFFWLTLTLSLAEKLDEPYHW